MSKLCLCLGVAEWQVIFKNGKLRQVGYHFTGQIGRERTGVVERAGACQVHDLEALL